MSLFRLDANRARGSRSRRIADIVEQEWRYAHPSDPVINREIGLEPLPSDAWASAAFGRYLREERRSPQQREAIALAAKLTDELAAADALLFAVPLYDYAISHLFRTLVDLVTTDPRMAAGSVPLVAGRPGVLVIVRCGASNHAVGWVRRILEDLWKLDLRVMESEFTFDRGNPQLDGVNELARAHGQSLSTLLAA